MSLFRPQNSEFLKYRLVLLVSMGIILSIGYGVRFSHGPAPEWLNDAIGGIAYESFWILLVAFLSPRTALGAIAIAVCLVTFALEGLQLWHPPLLQAARATLIGRLILGNTFNWCDFPPYVVGSCLGWLWARVVQRLGASNVGDR